MLRVIEGKESHQDWLRFGGVETLESYGFDGDLNSWPPDHMNFFSVAKRELYLQDNYFLLMPLTTQSCRWTSNPVRCCVGIHARRYPPAHASGVTAIVGHTANRQGEVLDFKTPDLYRYLLLRWPLLTALDVHNRAIWQVSRDGFAALAAIELPLKWLRNPQKLPKHSIGIIATSEKNYSGGIVFPLAVSGRMLRAQMHSWVGKFFGW